MIKIKHIEIEDLENEGCNNGNYPECTITFEYGTEYVGYTYRCGNGCSGTLNINAVNIGDEFESIKALEEVLEG